MKNERKTGIIKIVNLKIIGGKLEKTLSFLPISEKVEPEFLLIEKTEDSWEDNYLNR